MNIFVADEQSEPVDVAAIRDLVAAVLRAEGCPPQTEVSVILVGDEEMAGYNRRFLDRSGPTDVISLPIEELRPGQPPGAASNGGPPPMLGDVILSPAYIRRQADELGETFEDEIALMVVHGVLHLLGYEHDSAEEAEMMEKREAEILHSVGRRRR
ncbi:MAG TPA: rRNA maturation RNase YbeY [Acidimicrobiia bacterium]|nr:rRNA maturation RNase YbeY [Acidimicrobiia bacterium]